MQNAPLGSIDNNNGLIERIFKMLLNAEAPHDLWHWILIGLPAFFSIYLMAIGIIKSLKGFAEIILKCIEAYKSSGLSSWINKDIKVKVRRRKQFCGVLDSDLSNLGKAENWNDHNFTDLEAEVETEGGYYANAIDRLRKKKSFGLRKERSLIHAIESSTERAMQLVGEPGSGKSVALRHLAKQLAEKGKKSNDINATVPLYINLREMDHSDLNEINVDSIKKFILDNIRHGDADTSAFVRENWDDYCDRGIWLFLFDSFDEIPAVLHAAAGSNVIRHYSQALRQFLEGMGECQGILASREFKGPEALPWNKLRILPLSGEKQDELIRNSYLHETSMDLARHHLAHSHSSIGSTPLFLTLLCRYIKDEAKAPSSDHDILIQHIERLARRDSDYLYRKFKLSPEELMVGAERLARLFAENEKLSLAPSLDQIKSQLPQDDIPGESLEVLISALVDTKIGRADVPNAKQGDRRFAFAHRRYQEALFVRYLTLHPETLSPDELLTDSRWREYTVTLLQTCSYKEISPILDRATQIISGCAVSNSHEKCGQPPLPIHLIYFKWSSEIAVTVLSLLQDGMAHRINEVPPSLSSAVSAFLEPRWGKGDNWDRSEVLRLGGLLPHDKLAAYIVETFKYGTHSEKLNAFRQAAFTSYLPEEARADVLRMLSEQVITARKREDQLTIEALAARLPTSIGAGFVVARCRRLRKNLMLVKRFYPLMFLPNILSRFFSIMILFVASHQMVPKTAMKNFNENFQHSKEEIDLTLLFGILLAGWPVLLVSVLDTDATVLKALFIMDSFFLLIAIIMFSPFLVRDVGKKVRSIDAIIWAFKLLLKRTLLTNALMSVFAMILLIMTSTFLGFTLIWFARKFIDVEMLAPKKREEALYFLYGLVTLMMMFYIYAGVKIFLFTRKKNLHKKRAFDLLCQIKSTQNSDMGILFNAENYEQLILWLEQDDSILSDAHSIRSFSSYTLDILRSENNQGNVTGNLRPNFLLSQDASPGSSLKKPILNMKILRQNLEYRLLETQRTT